MTTSRGLSPTRQKPPIKSTASTPNIRKMAAVTSPPGLPPSSSHFRNNSQNLSTLRDPRSTGDLREAASIPLAGSLHPDLNLEVAALSNKLISAINHQTYLDDTLGTTKEELHQTQERLKQADARNAEWDSLLREGRLLRRAEFDEAVNDLLRKLSTEKKARDLADREKRAIEMELADLSTKLFEEANELVSKARKETEASDQRTEQVRGQLADAESLLSSQQEQLAQLKAILERSTDRAEAETTTSTAPPTPALASASFDQPGGLGTPQFPNGELPEPAPALTFSNLIAPVLRTDVPAYEDFKALLEINRKAASASAPASRVTSGSYGGLGVAASIAQSSTNSSQTNIAGVHSNPHSPTPSSTMPGSIYSPTAYIPLLRETKFFKRALSEDIEPTLRLDVAPGLSYFARRSVSAAVNDNTLMLEPVPAGSRKLITSCTLCGERRRGDEYARTHRFKAGDDSAQWYPLCAYCVVRFRSVCDYIGFMRMVRDGLWRCEGKGAEDRAWEESVRLRERMFWARVGGGVVPACNLAQEEVSAEGSNRPSLDVALIDKARETSSSAADDGASEALHTPLERSADRSVSTDASTTNSESDEILQNIRELPSTAPPLQATMLPSNELSPRQVSGGSVSSDSMTSPIRLSLTDSLKRISLRDSLRFGSRSRNASTERAPTPSAIATPQLHAVDEAMTPDADAAEEINEKQYAAMRRQESDGLNIQVPGGF